MGGISVWQLLIIVIYIAVIVIPIFKILQKAGYSGWLSLLAIVPLLNLIMLWVFAFSNWPTLRGGNRDQEGFK